MKKILVFIYFILFFFLQSKGQDTLSIYFQFNSSKITDDIKIQIDNYLEKNNLNIIDSIYFIGVSDSIGNSDKNLLLSEKRAKNTSKYFLEILPDTIQSKYFAKGEEINSILDKSRRVEIIFFSTPIKPKPILHCYTIDYNLLHRINIKYPNQSTRNLKSSKKRGNIIIRVDKEDIDTSKQYSYAKYNKNGEFEIVKIKWRSRIIGIETSQKARYVAKMPYHSFDLSKIFIVSSLPCESCQDTIFEKIYPIEEVLCLQTDRFLMKNIQFKKSFFNPYIVKARVPRDFVNFNDIYYNSCSSDIIRWSKRNRKYSYAKIPIDDIYVRNITRLMPCCSKYQESSDCNKPALTLTRIKYPEGNSYLHFHLDHEYNTKHITNLGTSITFDSFKFHSLLFVGLNSNKQINSLLRLQYSFFSYPSGFLLECISWGSLRLPFSTSNFSKIYVGSDFNAYLGNGNSNFSQNLNVGFAIVNYSDIAIIKRFFIQYEYWTLNNRNFTDNGIRVGILTRLYNFKNSNI